MSSNRKAGKRIAKASTSFVLTLILIFSALPLAFADFVPVTPPKVLGVGRIQSTVPDVPVSPEDKFALSSAENQASELVEPIAREVAPVDIVEPDQASLEELSGTVTDSGTTVAPESGWITTLATNYATPYDGFLGKMTASGSITTTTSMGVAHKNLPLGTVIELYCPRTGLSCIVTVDDRGPYDGRPDTFDFQMGVTAALGNNTGWYQVLYRIV